MEKLKAWWVKLQPFILVLFGGGAVVGYDAYTATDDQIVIDESVPVYSDTIDATDPEAYLIGWEVLAEYKVDVPVEKTSSALPDGYTVPVYYNHYFIVYVHKAPSLGWVEKRVTPPHGGKPTKFLFTKRR